MDKERQESKEYCERVDAEDARIAAEAKRVLAIVGKVRDYAVIMDTCITEAEKLIQAEDHHEARIGVALALFDRATKTETEIHLENYLDRLIQWYTEKDKPPEGIPAVPPYAPPGSMSIFTPRPTRRNAWRTCCWTSWNGALRTYYARSSRRWRGKRTMMNKAGITAKVLSFLSFVKGARWLRPSQSPEAAHCAVMEFDLELPASTVAMMGIVTAVLRKFDPRVDTDHPTFLYLGQQQVAGKPSNITLTLSIKRTQTDAGN